MHAFPKSVRLRRNQEFRGVLDHGRKSVGPLLVLFIKPRQDMGGPRLGLIASRKVGSAVQRNKVKRALREAFRHLQPDALANPGLRTLDLVVVARAAAATASSAAIAEALRRALERIKFRTPEAP